METIERVIGITGLKAAGKDTLAAWLRTKGVGVRAVSDAIRDELKRRGVAVPSVAEMQDVGNWGRGFGLGFWAIKTLEAIAEEGYRVAAVNGLRHPGEVHDLRREFGERFVLVGVTAPTAVRYARLASRARSGDPLQLTDFLAMDDRDRGVGEPADGQHVDRTLALVEPRHLYCNIGSEQELKAWAETVLAGLFVTA